MEPSGTGSSDFNITNIIDTLIRLGILFLLISLCIDIVKPFSFVLIWGVIIAIVFYPIYKKLNKLFRGHRTLSAILIVLGILSILVIPAWFLTGSIITEIDQLRELYSKGDNLIPPPGETVKAWPTFLKPVVDLWQLASDNLGAAVMQHKDEFTKLGSWLLSALSSLGSGLSQFLISVIIAAFFLVNSDSLISSSQKLFNRLAPSNGGTYSELIVNTIQAVVKGVLGVAVIQAALAGLGLYLAGVPYAGVWTVLCLMLSITQIGSWVILFPISFYEFATNDLLTAILFLVWVIFVTSVDNFLTPYLMGRKSTVPSFVLFIGATGGLMSMGFLGLFLGAVLFSIGYSLFIAWMNADTQN
ncbi:MAG: AI-2E family transporter [Ignavibacteria bacterium]|nr:AI-2E family transporter [Ignavibacteria bacterium]